MIIPCRNTADKLRVKGFRVGGKTVGVGRGDVCLLTTGLSQRLLNEQPTTVVPTVVTRVSGRVIISPGSVLRLPFYNAVFSHALPPSLTPLPAPHPKPLPLPFDQLKPLSYKGVLPVYARTEGGTAVLSSICQQNS
ncbi:hypothetical protein ElyMa_003064600 [Elysia marginata]|uniref:Uncharacterized protein n=1 Tax=Elysia marginata TaxID=1093978 RepID=A0AAV4IL95_9GAST|nr:hypothetical protein ElyMa_003064600 [Elysia marginata]